MNVALIGYGYWGPNLLSSFEGTKYPIRYVVDKSKENLERARAFKNDLVLLESIDEALDNKEIDAVVIALPTGLHYEIAKKALLCGKHVFIEKPMTDKLGQCYELASLAREKRLVFMVDHNFVYKKSVQKMRELAKGGELGRLQYFKSSRLNLGIFRPQDDVIWDLAPHDISIVKYIMGKNPNAVSATAVSHMIQGKYDMAQLTLYYDNSFMAQIDISWVFPQKIRLSYLGGDKGVLLFNDNEPENKLTLFPVGYDVQDKMVNCTQGEPYFLEKDTENALMMAGMDFISSIENRKQPISNAEFGCDVVKIIEALERSASLGGAKIYL